MPSCSGARERAPGRVGPRACGPQGEPRGDPALWFMHQLGALRRCLRRTSSWCRDSSKCHAAGHRCTWYRSHDRSLCSPLACFCYVPAPQGTFQCWWLLCFDLFEAFLCWSLLRAKTIIGFTTWCYHAFALPLTRYSAGVGKTRSPL